jgi:TonB family protein
MAESSNAGEVRAEHLSVRADGGPSEVMFAFGHQSQRMLPAVLSSALLDIGVVVFFILLSRYGPTIEYKPAVLPEDVSDRIVWLQQPGPGGGGGGGGNKMQAPPRQAELPGKDKITVPVEKPKAIEPLKQEPPKEEPPPLEQVNIPAKLLASSDEILTGAIEAPPGPPAPLSLGSGSGGGAGTGTGTGIGSGTGSGLGAGSGGGTGGGVYRPGNGVTTPRLLRQVKPAYTSDAMRAKVQGTVLLQCTVMTDGSVSDIRVLRSVDSVFGLDQEAIKAARQWKFAPGTRMGQPVPVEITIELSFSLR